MSTTVMTLPLSFEGREVRFVGSPDKPEWVASDVCAILEISKTDRALAGFDDDEKGAHTVSTPGGPQRVATVYEPGLYKLIFRSRKPQAARFRRWVFHEVLPSIRKTGAYGLHSELEAARAQVALLLDISTKQASLNASMLARRGHQLRVEEKALAALARGQRLLIPGAEPIRTVERNARRTAATTRRTARRTVVVPKSEA